MCIRRLTASLLASLWAGLVLGLLAPGAAGEEQDLADVYTVREVPVDVTAETAAAARETAHAQGHVAAMERLLARLLPRADLAGVPPFGAGEVAQLVKDFEVADERTSDVRYLARMTFRFRPEAVRGFLRARGLPYAEVQSKPVVVVPVFGAEGRARLWDEANPWRAAWARRPPGGGLVPLVVPLGDLGDIAALDAHQALAGDLDRLSALAQRYGAEDVVVTQAVLLGDPEAGQATVQVGTSRLGRQQHATIIENYAQEPEESVPDLFARAAEAVAAEVQERWKQQNLLHPGAQHRISVRVPVGGLADWLAIKSRLAGVAGVQESEVTMLSRAEARVEITFVGDEDQLTVAMAQNDLSLTFEPVGGWRLRLAGAEAAPEPAPGRPGLEPTPRAAQETTPEVAPTVAPASPGPNAPAIE